MSRSSASSWSSTSPTAPTPLFPAGPRGSPPPSPTTSTSASWRPSSRRRGGGGPAWPGPGRRATPRAERPGAAGALVVTPYYNKPPQEGLYRHFKAIAEGVDIPILVYNIQSRTAVNVETDTLA